MFTKPVARDRALAGQLRMAGAAGLLTSRRASGGLATGNSPARTRIGQLLQAAGARGVAPTTWLDTGAWYRSRDGYSDEWIYPTHLEQQVQRIRNLWDSSGATDLIAPAAGAGVIATARVNLLSQTEFRNGLSDATTRAGLITASSLTGYAGAIAFGYDGSTLSYAYKSVSSTLANTQYRVTVTVEMTDGSSPVFGGAAATSALNDFGLITSGGTVNMTTATVTALGSGRFRVSVVVTTGASPPGSFGLVKYTSNTSRTFKVTAYDVRLAVYDSLNLPAYQRVGDGTAGVFDYDHAGFPVRLVRSAVSNSALHTAGTVDFTNTDALHAGAVVVNTASSDGILMETSQNAGTNNGAIYLFNNNAGIRYDAVSRGSTLSGISQIAREVPGIDAVLSSSDISTPKVSISADGVAGTPNAATQGTGNYGNHRLNIFMRDPGGSPSLPFSGGMFCTPFLIDRNVVSDADAAELLRDMARIAGHTY